LLRPESRPIVDNLFFDKIFELLLMTDDERNKLKSIEILANLVHSEEHRLKLANEDYLKRVYSTFSTPSKADNRTLEKIS
jgi:hypothetical protein